MMDRSKIPQSVSQPVPPRWPVALWQILLGVNIFTCFVAFMLLFFAEEHAHLRGHETYVPVMMLAARIQFLLMLLSVLALVPLKRGASVAMRCVSFIIPTAAEAMLIVAVFLVAPADSAGSAFLR